MVAYREQLPNNIFKSLEKSCRERRLEENWNYNERLVGALDQQSSLDPPAELEDYLASCASQLWEHVYTTCPWDGGYHSQYFELRNLWVNFQKPGQYNPYHCHHGIISFVIFVDIPYGPEERQYNSSDGSFQLETELIPVDRSWNGYLLMFPSHTNHAVYPYRSTDEERITVAGNLFWNVEGTGEEHY